MKIKNVILSLLNFDQELDIPVVFIDETGKEFHFSSFGIVEGDSSITYEKDQLSVKLLIEKK